LEEKINIIIIIISSFILNIFAVLIKSKTLILKRMKNSFQKLTMVLSVIALIAIMFTLNSCKKSSEETTTPVIVLDGYYVKGAVTAYPTFNGKAMMKIAKNEVDQTDRDSLLELYIPIKAGTAGFNIVKVAGSTTTVYGPGSGFTTITTGTTDEPKFPFQRGPAAVTATPFTVPSDGMYHVVFDFGRKVVVVAPVHWGMIGAATPHGWTTDTMMTESAFNQTTMSWTLTDLKLLKGDWKLRYSHGWKIEIDTSITIGSTKGIKVNTNFGGTVAALVAGGANIVNADAGIYTAVLTCTVGSGYTVTLTKTGNIPPIDYSTYQMGIIGSCYLKKDGNQAAWDENFGTQLPVVTGGTNYDWTYNIPINLAGEFKFRQGEDWSGKSIGYPDVTMAGAAAGNFSNDGGNFKVDIVGNYTLVLHIDAVAEAYTVTATLN
jgi:hypothetical protein